MFKLIFDRLEMQQPSVSSGGSSIATIPTVKKQPMTTPSTPQKTKKKQKRPRSRNHTLANSMPAVHIRTHDMLNPQERRFLEAAEKGNRPTIIACLRQKNVPLNVNAIDAMGRTAIEIAVDNENMEIVQLLLQQEGIRIGNALLCAIREGVYELVEVLINHPSITKEMLGEGWSKSLDPAQSATSEYSSDISPVILAAHLNQFEILQMLLHKDATIEKPHKSHCPCETCETERINNGLASSLKRINTYRALASPAWISLTSPDPILTAFKLSRELQKRAKAEDEFKDTYLQLSEQCKQYACDLLSQCRSTEEVMAVLNKEDGQSINEEVDAFATKCSLARLKRAIKYEQKTFVSHPHCQQLLTSIWYEGFPLKKRRGSVVTIFTCAALVLAWPLLAVCYIIMPKSRVGEIVRSPFMKFLYFSLSFGCFLVLLTLVTFEPYREQTGEIKGGGQHRAADRGPPPTHIEWLVFVWVIGMFWSEVKQLWEEGFTKYVTQWWNWLDFIMICLYLCTIAIRVSAYYVYVHNNPSGVNTPRHVIRTHWHEYEPMLVSEALFAVGNVFSFARIIYLFQTNPYLGPLQISLGCMLVDVAKFCFIFVLIITSFSIGLAQLYWYYDPTDPVCISPENCKLAPNAFSSIANSYMTLLWSLFSITKVEDTDVVEEHYFTQWIGRGLFIMYHMTSIIVLLNMLIAMMSHSFERINDHADLEWKFHRTKLWMAHFDEGSTLPPPFNIVVTPKAMFKALRALFNTIRWMFGAYHYKSDRSRATIRRPGYHRRSREVESGTTPAPDVKKPTYMEIIQRLVSRFILEQKRSIKMDGVNEDDLLEIKQDISSLRYELRDDRQREIVRSSSHIDAVKRDIMRTMSASTRMFAGAPPRRALSTRERPRTSVAEESDFYDDEDSDSEMKSQVDSVYAATLSPTTSAKNYDIPSITLAAGEEKRDLLIKEPEDGLTATATTVGGGGGGDYDRYTEPLHGTSIKYRSRPGCAEESGNQEGEAGSTTDRFLLRKRALCSKKSAPCHLTVDRGGGLTSKSGSALEMLIRFRDSFNDQLDRLAADIIASSAGANSEPDTGDGVVVQEGIARPETPASAPIRNVSPSRVSFSSVTK